MKIERKTKIGGTLDWLEVRRKGRVIHRVENVPNLLLNAAMRDGANARLVFIPGQAYLMTSTSLPYEDLPGTWDQTGNTLTRTTGAGTFPSSPSQLGQELRWNTGERCHVTARASDTSITVSGTARSITGGTLRRFFTNSATGTPSSTSGFKQNAAGTVATAYAANLTTGVAQETYFYAFASATVAYVLGSIVLSSGAYIQLPATVDIEVDDQVTFSYTRVLTETDRSQLYELGAEAVGIPQKYMLVSITGSGTAVDVTFSGATHFLAGDKLDLRNIVTKRFAISSASSTGTTLTINTTTASGLTTGDSVVIAGASLAGYNGTFTVATGSGTTFTITDPANPGAMGASGTARLATPAGYFNTLGLATIASMVSSSVARITSTVTGPAVDLVATGGDPGITFIKFGNLNNNALVEFAMKAFVDGSQPTIQTPASATNPAGTSVWNFDSVATVTSSYSNDWTLQGTFTKNAGAGTAATRLRQVLHWFNAGFQLNFNTPFNKTTTERLTVVLKEQLLRDLP